MTKLIFSLAAVCLAVACAESDGESTGAAMLGLHADDDGCPGTWGCKAAPEEPPGVSGVGGAGTGPEAEIKCNPWGCEPWPTRDEEAKEPDICKVFPDYPWC